MAKDSAARIELSRSFHQEGTVNGTVNLKVCESASLGCFEYVLHQSITSVSRRASSIFA